MKELLTGKCREEFEKWYSSMMSEYEFWHEFIDGTFIDKFVLMPFSMQWGVYLEYFDSVGTRISINNWDNRVLIKTEVSVIDFGKFNSQSIAQIESIKAANQLRNEQD